MAQDAHHTLAQKLANPAWRHGLKDSQLTPGLLAKRKAAVAAKAQNSTLYDPLTVLSGQSLHRAVNDVVDSQTRPQLNELDRQAAQAAQQGGLRETATKGYYSQLADSLVSSQQQAKDTVANTAGWLQGVQGQNQQAMADLAKHAEGRMQASADLRGPGLGGGAASAIEAQGMDAGRVALADSNAQNANLGTSGDNWQNLLIAMSANAGQRGAQAVGDIGAATQANLTDLAGKRADLVAQRGDLRTKTLLDLRQQGFNQDATAQGLNIKTTAANAQATAAGASAKATAQNRADTFLGRFGVSAKDYRNMSVAERIALKGRLAKAGKAPPKGSTTDHYGYDQKDWEGLNHAQRLNAKAQWQRAGAKGAAPSKGSTSANKNLLAVKDWVDQYLRDHPGSTRAQVVAFSHKYHGTTSKPYWPDPYLAAALDLSGKTGVGPGYITPTSAKRLKPTGIKVDSSGQLK